MYFIKASQSHPAKELAPQQTADTVNPIAPTDDDKTEVKQNHQSLIKKGNPARAQIEAEEAVKSACQRVAELSTIRGSDDPEFKNAVKIHESAKKILKSKQGNAKRQRKFQQNRKR